MCELKQKNGNLYCEQRTGTYIYRDEVIEL